MVINNGDHVPNISNGCDVMWWGSVHVYWFMMSTTCPFQKLVWKWNIKVTMYIEHLFIYTSINIKGVPSKEIWPNLSWPWVLVHNYYVQHFHQLLFPSQNSHLCIIYFVLLIVSVSIFWCTICEFQLLYSYYSLGLSLLTRFFFYTSLRNPYIIGK